MRASRREAHVARYRLRMATLKELTRAAMVELGHARWARAAGL